MDDLEISTDASPALHPHNFVALTAGPDDPLYSALEPAIMAFAEVSDAMTAIAGVRDALLQSKTMHKNEIVLKTADYAEKKLAVAKSIDTAHASLKGQIAVAEAALRAPLEATVHSTAAAEIRALARDMEPGARRKLIADSIDSGDKTILSALLSAHPFTTNLTKVEVEQYTRIYRERSSPELAKRVEVLTKAVSMIHERAGLVISNADRLIGVSKGELAAIRASDAKARAALAK